MTKHTSSIRQAADDIDPSKFAIAVEVPSYVIQGVYVVDMLIARNYSKRFAYYDTDDDPLEPAEALALHFRDTLKALDGQIKALAEQATASFDPYTDYSRTRQYAETAGNTRETTYGKTDTRLGNSSNTTTYNSTVTGDVVTYDDTLRDQSKTTRGGTDSDAGTSASTSTLSGKDTMTDDGERAISENVSGYNKSKSKSLAEYLDVMLRDDLLDYVLGEFERRYLYYGGDWS